MVSFQLALFLFVSMVSSAPTSGTCCTAKAVGNITYMLVESDKEDMTRVYGCKDGCVYEAEDVTGKFCFKDGERPVNCLDWGYNGDIGPSHWGKHYKACNGKSQSPINIVYHVASVVPEPFPPLSFQNYDKVRFNQFGNTEEHFQGDPTENGHRPKNDINNGHTAQLDVISNLSKGVGVLSGGPLDGHYQILQLHFHWGENNTIGSEHTLNGKQYPMEMHIVHKKMSMNISENLNKTGGLAVTGFFFKVGRENPAIEPLIKLLKNIIKPNTFVNVSGLTFKLSHLVAGVAPIGNEEKSNYSFYNGSLTTPDCLQGVKWINFVKPINISSNQLAHFRTLKDVHYNDILKNYRPVQWLNNRTVTVYRPLK